jgi:predicted AlkP superfamily pyrophosphatase or phosphodiesterase
MNIVTTFLLAALALAIPAAAQTPHAPHVRYALIVSIDGLRPDVLLRADAPTLRGLMQRGIFSMWARTTDVAITLPSHTSMLTGEPPERHGVTWNGSKAPPFKSGPQVPTLFTLAHRQGLTTALVAGKRKFGALRDPGAVDWSFVPDEETQDAAVADSAVEIIRRHSPNVLFVHLPGVDMTGHAYGWGSETQVRAVTLADRSIERVLKALREQGTLDSTVIVVSADHGGSGTSHGAGDERSRYIPWIAVGPGLPANVDLDQDASVHIRTEDTFATVCSMLGIPLPAGIAGRPVKYAAPTVAGQ